MLVLMDHPLFSPFYIRTPRLRVSIPIWHSAPIIQYSIAPILHHSVWLDSRPRTKRLVRNGPHPLKQRYAQDRLSNKFLQDVAGWRHYRAGMSISEQAFDTQPFRER